MNIYRLLLLLVSIAIIPQRALCWGDEGHEVVAVLAQKILQEQGAKSQAAKKTLATLKKILGSTSIAQAADWPDEIKNLARDCSTPPFVKDPNYGRPPSVGKSSAICEAYNFTSSWHYINTDNSAYAINSASEDYFKGDMAVLINGLSHLLKGEPAPVLNGVTSFSKWKEACLSIPNHNCKKEALEFLIHLVGDIHQPLHVGAICDLGANLQQIRFFGEDNDHGAFWCEARKPSDPKTSDYSWKMENYKNCIHHEFHHSWDVNLLVNAPKSKYKSSNAYALQLKKAHAKSLDSSDSQRCVKVAASAAVQIDGVNGPVDWANESLCYIPQVYSFPDDVNAQAMIPPLKNDKRRVAQSAVANRCRFDRKVKAVDETGKVILNKDGSERIAYFKPFEVGTKYFTANISTIDERLYWAGARLSTLLLDIYGSGDKAPDFD